MDSPHLWTGPPLRSNTSAASESETLFGGESKLPKLTDVKVLPFHFSYWKTPTKTASSHSLLTRLTRHWLDYTYTQLEPWWEAEVLELATRMNGVCWINLPQRKQAFQPSHRYAAKETEQNRGKFLLINRYRHVLFPLEEANKTFLRRRSGIKYAH